MRKKARAHRKMGKLGWEKLKEFEEIKGYNMALKNRKKQKSTSETGIR